MYYRILTYILFIWCSIRAIPGYAQQDLNCNAVDQPITNGEVFFNFGSVTDAYSIRNRSSYALGQPVVGNSISQSYNSQAGFWSRFLIPPLAPIVTASQGELLDRIQVSWSVNPLGSPPNLGFKVYRDGVFLALVDNKTNNFNDFNVISGRAYLYQVRGLNDYGQSDPGQAIGFQVPNGVVTGWIQTPSGQPVPDAFVTLTPLQGFSARFGASNGAFAKADAGTAGSLIPSGNGEWTLAFWLKTGNATANAALMSLSPFPLFLRPVASAGGHEGIEVAQTAASAALLTSQFPDSTKNGWHHVALTMDANHAGRLYVDGTLVGIAALPSGFTAGELRIGARTGASGTWQGQIDELRVYHRRLDELDFGEVMMGTASSQTPDLKYYWKMDEELGTGSFDVLRRNKLFFCGATFVADRPLVRTMGKTNQQGFYRIESASYGTGVTFLADPMKDFYLHRALNFTRSEGDYATLPDFSMTPKATLELWVNSGGPNGNQCLLSKIWPGNEFRLLLKPNGLGNDIWCYFNGQERNFGALGNGYHLLALTIDSSGTNRVVTAYKDGVALGNQTFTGVTGNWSAPTGIWMLGARLNGSSPADYFDGLIDELAVYDTTLSAASILNHHQSSRNLQENGLRIYYGLNEGNGNRLINSGSVLLPYGTNFGAGWSPFAAQQMTTPHVFTPVTRQVTLNPSVTSVDQVDFIDRSTVPVTGFVRYKNTDCFAPNVEILVNGASFSPKIFTDSTGKFTIDFDPGTTATLTPVFEDHVFVPAFWDVSNVVNPIAGILFNDVTTRTVSGQVAGGLCKKSVITAPPGTGQGTVCVVKIRSADGCLERQITIDNQEGDFEFPEVPPLKSLTVAVVEHSNPDIKAAFQQQGGYTVDLTKNDTVVDFTYFAPPEVELTSGLDPFPGCNPEIIVLDQNEPVAVSIRLKEQYVATMSDNGVCYLDSAGFQIINGFADQTLDTAIASGTLQYQFRVGNPNPSPPYLKTMQITGTSIAGRTGSLTKQGVVTGILNKEGTFTTKLPETPTLILRDPPGDASSAFLEENTQVCKSYSFSMATDASVGYGLEVHLGGNVEVAIGVGVATIQNAGPILDSEVATNFTFSTVDDSTMQSCISFASKVSTSSGDSYIGEDADLYMGEAIDIKFGLADKVTFDPMSCSPATETVINVEPGNQPTTFIYSHAYINDYLIPYLELLRDDPMAAPAQVADYEESITRWTNILDRNRELKGKAKFKRHISFDALNTIEYSETSEVDTTANHESGSGTDLADVSHVGFQFNDFGAQVIVQGSYAVGTTKVNGVEHTSGITTGYTLSDDDPNDAFSLDVAMDSVYSTPVFKLYAGQSSCPWEEGTANREGPNLALAQGAQPVAINLPANEPAVFKMNLGNLSATNEDWTYGFTAVPNSNPHGAIIKLNGQTLNNNTVPYVIPYGVSIPITLTIERGPTEYDYDSLLVALVSECEYANDLALSTTPDSKFFSALYLSAHFIRPCSEVAINVPEQDWVLFPDPLTPGPDDERRITVSGYDTTVTDFQLVRVQYRRSDGDGAWINIPGISDRYNPNWSGFAALPDPKPPVLQPGFTQFFWETTGLSDGPYEIRAVAVCSGDAFDKPGFSQVIKGRIDREPPSLVGTPQPSDGAYNLGDEISFTFNKHINCNQLIPADNTQPNNVGLYDAATGQLIDITVTCFENKIVLDPSFQNEFFENRILRAELHDIEDKTGNKRPYIDWEFYVDRNELAWLTDSVGMTKNEGEIKTATASIHNRGGYPVPFSIRNMPDWVRVVPDKGTLAPNEVRPISFTVDSTLAFGLWSDSVTLHTETGQNPFFMGGDEGLPIGVRVVCRPPDWNLDAGIYPVTMNMVLKLNIEGEFSADVEDIAAAYIDGELRGRAHVQFVPQIDQYLAYLTIYGESAEAGQTVSLQLWDASACLRYGAVIENFTFQPDNLIGTAVAPQVVHTTGLVLREIPIDNGWNWMSFNLAFPNPAINPALTSLQHPDNDLMKGQSAFSTYSAGWFGTLSALGNTSMYQYRADQPDTLKMLGNLIDPASVNIPVVTGWNWLGYLPNFALPVNNALVTLNPQNGDLIKSQTEFAEYINGFGWLGNLKFMQPPKGYQLRLSNPGVLTYPGSPFRPDELAEDRGDPPASRFWQVDPAGFEQNMTLIGMLAQNGQNVTAANTEIGAFAGGELRGATQAIWVEPAGANLYFLTTYANTGGELLHFKQYNPADGSISALSETMTFVPDLHQGSIQSPVPFTLQTTGAVEISGGQTFDIQPNPFSDAALLLFHAKDDQELNVLISDVSGRVQEQFRWKLHAGKNAYSWRPGAGLPSGVYIVRLETATGTYTRKIVRE